MTLCLARPLAALALVWLVPSAAYAGVNAWTSNGPAVVQVRALVLDPTTPTTLYAGTQDGGVHRSLDGGDSWSALNDLDLADATVVTIAVDPTTPATIYAGSTDEGVYRTVDGGTTWTPSNAGLAPAVVLALAIDPATTTTLYAGTDGGGVFKSLDGGASWTPANTGLGATVVHSIVLDPSDPSVVYAGVTNGVAKSVDGGATWTNTGIATTVFTVVVDPDSPTTLYAGTLFQGIFKSSNGGGTWTASNNGLTAPTVRSLAIDAVMPTTLYAGTPDSGVFTSTNAGAGWTPLNDGLTHGNVPAVRVDPVVNELLHAATLGGGVFHYELDRCHDEGEPIDCGSCQTCDVELGCIGAPLPACRVPALEGKARLRIKNDSTEARDHFVWTWARGAATPLAAFGDPTSATGYEMCIFDESGIAPALLMRARMDAGGLCKQGKPCWKVAKKGFKYRNGEALPDGLTKLLLRQGETAKAKVVLKGRGAPLTLPAFPMPLPFRFQLRNDLGECWEAVYTATGTVKNDETRFNAKSAP